MERTMELTEISRIKDTLQSMRQWYFEPKMTEDQINSLRNRISEAKFENRRERRKTFLRRTVVCAAAVLCALVILPNISCTVAHAMEQIPVLGKLVRVFTIRNYEYEDDRHQADVKIPALEIDDLENDGGAGKEEWHDNLQKSTGEINAEISRIASELIGEFKDHMYKDMGYRDLVITSEVLPATENYFTLKLLCYQAEASGYEWNYFYTIDLRTGERIKLSDLFVEGADYAGRISENIKDQMRSRMAADENQVYWIDSEMPDMDFQAITEETSFYLNEKNNIIISFNEGDVGPMYMGVVEFEIPQETLADIRK